MLFLLLLLLPIVYLGDKDTIVRWSAAKGVIVVIIVIIGVVIIVVAVVVIVIIGIKVSGELPCDCRRSLRTILL